ncbi:MAG TPA: hypothetical protein VIV60_20470 [Polyangiaceae bacterium]
MTFARSWQSYFTLAMVLSCQSSPASKHEAVDDPSTGGDVGTATGPFDDAGGTMGTDAAGTGSTVIKPTGTGSTGSSTKTASQGGVAGKPSTGTGGVSGISTTLNLTKVTARIGGRWGDDLIVTVEGTGTVGALASVALDFMDALGKPQIAFDSDWDGNKDSASGRVVPAKMPTINNFNTDAVLKGMRGMTAPSKVNVSLFDRDGNQTKVLAVAVQPQPIVDLGGGCDPTFVANRCRQGFTCSGTPGQCVDGTAPTIAHAMYHRGTDGPYIRVDGVDPDEDVILVRVDFLTAGDIPIKVDLDGDEEPDADHFEVEAGLSNQNGGYSFVVQSGLGFENLVPRLGLTAIDSRMNESPTLRASISNQTTRSSGQTCDLVGFVGCASGTSCIANAQGTTAYCTTFGQVESSRCSAARTWNIGKDSPKVTGFIDGYSAWQAPSNCVASTVTNRPEAVIKMHLMSAVSQLTLTTAEPETQIDTAIYVLPSCTAASDVALDCNDDKVGFASSVTLNNLAVGDYYVIVESNNADTGSFGLSAKVTP